MHPLISILIPTYNRAHLVGETIDSIIAQTYTNWECIIIDDGSTDFTTELLNFYEERDSRIHFYPRPDNRLKGANACRNYGFELSTGEFIHWFDSDDLMAKDNLQEKIDYLLHNIQCNCCISKVLKFQGNFANKNFIINDLDLKVENKIYEEYITGRIPILNVTPLWRKRIFDGMDLYDEGILQFQDLDFYSRILYKNDRVGIINKELIYVRRNNDSISTNTQAYNVHIDSFLKVKERILQRTPNNKRIVNYIIRDILWAMRWSMSKKNYLNASQCLKLALKYKAVLSFKSKIKLERIAIFFKIFKGLKKGETRFSALLKL